MAVNDAKIISFLRKKDYKFIKNIWQWWTWKTVLLKDSLIDEEFVCKKYSPIYAEQKELYYDNFKSEIKILHNVFHRNIVRIFNYYLYPESHTWYILMDFIDWKEIDNYIKENPDKLDSVFKQTIKWFSYLEKNNILHRDIRPQNILITNEWVVKIIDFWFWKQIDFNNNTDKSISLNWRYDIPDDFKEKKYDTKTEIYFIWKLFEDIIKNDDLQDFSYNSLLRRMILKNPSTRIESFEVIERELIWYVTNSMFTESDKNTYSIFANEICWKIDILKFDSDYIWNIEDIIMNLENLYKDSILEDYIQNNWRLIKCFIKGSFRYNTSPTIHINIIKDFLSFLKWNTRDKQKIIINNLWGRFDSVEKEEISIEDIPF